MIYINGTKIKTPTALNIETYNLTKSGRTASGLMTMDLVAKKAKLNLTYEVLSGDDLKTILSLIDGTQMFFTVKYPDEDGVEKTITCYAGAIPRDRFRGSSRPGDSWYWKNVNFALIEQ